MTRLIPALALFLVPLLHGCSPFVMQCDHLSETDEQVQCLDTAFEELRADHDACYDERRGDHDDYDWVEYCEGLEPGHEDFDRCLQALEELEIRRYCESLEPGDEDWDRCRDSLDELGGLHHRTRRDVQDNDQADQRRSRIRDGLRDGRDIADCDRRPDRGEDHPCIEGETAARDDVTYVCTGGEWVPQ